MMCPLCLTQVGLIVAGTVSTGGLAALAMKLSRKKNNAEEVVSDLSQEENKDGDNLKIVSSG